MDYTEGLIFGVAGDAVAVPVLLISPGDAEVLRQYKKFLQRYGLREALFCNDCWNNSLSDGCDASVTDTQIVIKCRCKLRFHGGSA